MTPHTWSTRHIVGVIGGFCGHLALIVAGFVLMVVGLAQGVTMIMLPVGIVVGMLGFLMFVVGLLEHIEHEV